MPSLPNLRTPKLIVSIAGIKLSVKPFDTNRMIQKLSRSIVVNILHYTSNAAHTRDYIQSTLLIATLGTQRTNLTELNSASAVTWGPLVAF